MTAATRSRLYRRSAPALLIAFALAAAPAMAQDSGTEEETQPSPEELAIEGLDTLMRALELMLMQIPQYEMPEFNERGDIIIRRKNPPEPDAAPDREEEEMPESGATET